MGCRTVRRQACGKLTFDRLTMVSEIELF